MEKKQKEPSSVLENSLSALLEDAINLNHLSFTHIDKVKHYKLTKIKNIHDKLIETLPISFKRNIEDYNKTVKSLEKTGISLDVPFALTTYCYPRKHNEAVTYDFYSKESFNKFFSDMELIGSVDYIPPNDMREVMNHVFCLWITFQFIWKVPLSKSLEPCLDLSLLKLSDRVTNFYDYCIFYKERELNRINKSNMAHKEKISKSLVKNLFIESLDNGQLKGRSFNNVAEQITVTYEGRFKPKLSLDTVKRYLKADSNIMHNFKREGKIWIMQK